MIEKHLQTLQQSICDAFEKTAFMFLECSETKPQVEDSFFVKIEFESDYGKGRIALETSDEFLAELSSNLLGEEDLIMGQKSLLEMLNISAGHFLTDSFGFECKTHLGIPSQHTALSGLENFRSCCLMSDSMNPINIYLEMELKS